MCLQEPKFYQNSNFLNPTDLLTQNFNLNNAYGQSNKFYNHNNHHFIFDPLHIQTQSSSNNYFNQLSYDISFTQQEIKNFHNEFSSRFYDLINNEEPIFEEFKEIQNNGNEIASDKETNVSFEHQSPQQTYENQNVHQNYFNNENLEINYFDDYLPINIISKEQCEISTKAKLDFKHNTTNFYDGNGDQPYCNFPIPEPEQQRQQENPQDLLINRWKLPIKILDSAPPFFVSFRRYRRIMERKSKREQEKKRQKQQSHLMQMNWHKLMGKKDRSEIIVEKIFTIKYKKQKYKYESRHKQALNRVRDNRGRFVKNFKIGINSSSSQAISNKISKYSYQGSPSSFLTTSNITYHTQNNYKQLKSKSNLLFGTEAEVTKINLSCTSEYNLQSSNQLSQSNNNNQNTNYNNTNLNNDFSLIGFNNKQQINQCSLSIENESNKGSEEYVGSNENNQIYGNYINFNCGGNQGENGRQNNENQNQNDEFKFNQFLKLQNKQKEHQIDEFDNQNFFVYNQQFYQGFEIKSQEFNQDYLMNQYEQRVKKKEAKQKQSLYEQQQQSPILCSNFCEIFSDNEMNSDLLVQELSLQY